MIEEFTDIVKLTCHMSSWFRNAGSVKQQHWWIWMNISCISSKIVQNKTQRCTFFVGYTVSVIYQLVSATRSPALLSAFSYFHTFFKYLSCIPWYITLTPCCWPLAGPIFYSNALHQSCVFIHLEIPAFWSLCSVIHITPKVPIFYSMPTL